MLITQEQKLFEDIGEIKSDQKTQLKYLDVLDRRVDKLENFKARVVGGSAALSALVTLLWKVFHG